jgi:uncharacterized protein (TIGR03437 family)
MLRTRLTRRGDRRKGHSRKAASVVSLVLLATAVFGQTYAVSTLGGIWLPENLPGASVSLNQIGGVAVDAAGNVFLSLPEYAAVMRLDATIGILTRVAGNASNGFSGDAADSSGNIYSSDGIHILVLKPAGAISPPPSVSVDFIDNAASNQFLGIAPGEIVTVKGSGLGPAQLVSARAGADGLYPTQLGGTSVQFNGVAAPLIYASATQVAAVAPYGVTGPAVQVTVTYQGQTSIPATIRVFAAAPGLFTADGTGTGQAAAINQDGTINSASNPAPIGSVISLYATGGGQTLPAGVDGQVSTSPLAAQSLPVWAYIGLQPILSTAQLQYAGPAPGEIAGVMQINVPLPLGLQAGSAVPVAIFVGSPLSSSQSNVTIAVR